MDEGAENRSLGLMSEAKGISSASGSDPGPGVLEE